MLNSSLSYSKNQASSTTLNDFDIQESNFNSLILQDYDG